jgi:hypothetical protein
VGGGGGHYKCLSSRLAYVFTVHEDLVHYTVCMYKKFEIFNALARFITLLIPDRVPPFYFSVIPLINRSFIWPVYCCH